MKLDNKTNRKSNTSSPNRSMLSTFSNKRVQDAAVGTLSSQDSRNGDGQTANIDTFT